MACATFDGIITAMSSGGSGKGFQEYGSVSDPFEFVSTKSASVDRLKRWRQAALVLNSSRRFRYTLDLKKEEEKKRIAEKIRTHAQVIRAAFLYQAHGEKPDGKPLQTGTPEAHPSPIPTGNLNENSEQLASMTRDHNFSVLQNFGEEKVSTKMLKTKFDKGIDDVELNKSVGKYVFGSNTYPQKKAAQFFQTHGEKPDGKPLQTGTSEAHPSPIPTGNYNVESEQLTCMTTDHNLSVSQNFGGDKGTAEILKTNHDKGIDDDVLNKSVRKYVFGSNTYPQKKVRRNMANLHYDSNTLRSRVGENARSAHPRDWMFGDNFGKWVAFIGTYCTTSAMLLAFIALKFSGTLSSYETYGWFLIASIVAHATTITTSWLKFYTANDLRNPMKENLSLVCNKILNSVFWFSAIISHLSLLLVIILPHKIIWVGYAVLCPLFVVIFVLSLIGLIKVFWEIARPDEMGAFC